jgi:hypothetical protein
MESYGSKEQFEFRDTFWYTSNDVKYRLLPLLFPPTSRILVPVNLVGSDAAIRGGALEISFCLSRR